MTPDPRIILGSVIQLDPAAHVAPERGFFAGCYLVVTELKTWGVQGYIPIPGKRGEAPGLAYYRAKWDEIQWIGDAEWHAINLDGPDE